MGSESEIYILIFQHFGRLFLPGTLKNVPCCLNELLVNFREESRGNGQFCGFEVPTGGQLAQFRFFYRSWVNCTKQAVCVVQFSQLFLSRLGQLAIRWNSTLQNQPISLDSSRKLTNCSLREQGTFFNAPGRKSLPKC